MDGKLIVTAAPHVTSGDSTAKIMARVTIALIPSLIAAVMVFGMSALVLTAVTVAACVGFEFIWCKMLKQEPTIGDFSAVVTGLLLAFNLPANLPLWMSVVGAAVAIIMVKMLFGGLGFNFANPAIVARIALALGFTSAMTSYPVLNGMSSATPLASIPSTTVADVSAATAVADVSSATAAAATAEVATTYDYFSLFLGNHSGVLGETCALTLMLGGIYLIVTKVISPMIPVTYLGTVVLMSLLCGQDPIYQLLSGGLMLGAFFMATDYVTSPTTDLGKLIFGLGLGVITCMIRFYGSMSEGVSFAILIMNLLVPYIEPMTRQAKLGIAPQKKEEAKS